MKIKEDKTWVQNSEENMIRISKGMHDQKLGKSSLLVDTGKTDFWGCKKVEH